MARFVEGEDRRQRALLPEYLEDYVPEENPVRVIDVFVDELDLAGLGFERVRAASTGRPGYHPGAMLKLYLYGYLNQVQSSRRMTAWPQGKPFPSSLDLPRTMFSAAEAAGL